MTQILVGRRTFDMPPAPRASGWPAVAPPLEPPFVLDDQLPTEILRRAVAPLPNLYPYRMQTGYDRAAAPTELDTIVMQNGRLRAEFLPSLGGRLWSLRDLERDVELLHAPDQLRFANLALRNAWFAGGIEFNIGARGHAPHTCEPVHFGVVRGTDEDEHLRMWGYERIHRLVFQIDAILPDDASVLSCAVTVRNPSDAPKPLYWWTNAAVPESDATRVLAPTSAAYATDYRGGIARTEIDGHVGRDCSWPRRNPAAADFFFDLSGHDIPWITAIDGRGDGLFFASTAELPGRKQFVWGDSPGADWWQAWLTPSGARYLEIQGGVTPTQFEAIELAGRSTYEWVEVYGNLRAGERVLTGAYADASANAERLVHERIAGESFGERCARARRRAAEPVSEVLHRGEGWAALDALILDGIDDPRTPFDVTDLGPQQAAWRLVAEGAAVGASVAADAGDVAGEEWEQLLRASPASPTVDALLARLLLARGDDEAAAELYERADGGGERDAASARARAILATRRGADSEAARHYDAALRERPHDLDLAIEAATAAIDAGAAAAAIDIISRWPRETPTPGRLDLLEARARLLRSDAGDLEAARRLLEDGLLVPDLREGETSLESLWSDAFGTPAPPEYRTSLAPADGESPAFTASGQNAGSLAGQGAP